MVALSEESKALPVLNQVILDKSPSALFGDFVRAEAGIDTELQAAQAKLNELSGQLDSSKMSELKGP